MGGDGFRGREPQSQEEADQYQEWLDAWRVPYIEGAAEFKQMLTDVGFVSHYEKGLSTNASWRSSIPMREQN
jgi:hypothetical protein